MITMLDTVTPGAIGRLASTSPDAVAGYDDGLYNDIGELERLYPRHHHLAIAVFARDDGDCLDIETGDAVPDQAPGWVRRQHARGEPRPVLYANSSTMPAVKAALQRAGIGRNSVRLWRAQYDGRAELEADDDAKQYSDHWQGRNVDASVCRDDFFGLPPGRPVPKPKTKPVRKPKPKIKPRPKVVGATAAAGLVTVIQGVLHAVGLIHLTPAETSAITTFAAAVAGWTVKG